MSVQVILGAASVSVGVLCVWLLVAGDRRARARVAANLKIGLTADLRERAVAPASVDATAVPLLERVAGGVRWLTPAGVVDGLNRRITKAGMSSSWSVDRTLTMKFLLGGAGMLFGMLLIGTGSPVGVFYGVLSPVVGFFAPDEVLRLKAKDRQKRIRIALPDTLDQVTVCVEAGLGFEAAMARAARTGTGPLADELVRTLQDVQLGVPRKDAMRGLSERNSVDELRQFVQAIIQAEGYGVPIARVLRIHASELRDKRRQEAEEKAMKISIKMLFPLVTCILPTVFIVMVGPPIFQLIDALSTKPS